ncbi:MAG: DUF4302 domain-containing protein [Chitinophagaceae bacterium]
MKRIIYFLFALSLTGCVKHDVELVFDKLPEDRMKERNAELQSKLLEGTNGWQAFLKTSATGKGFGFYMKFNDVGEVTMYSDWNNTYAVTPKQSTYRISFVMNTQLSFDTYNYISLLQDPQCSVNGGFTPDGLESDIEFEYLRSSGDTVVLQGKKYRNYLYLIKATAAEGTAFTNGNYLTAMNMVKNYKNYPYIVAADGANTAKIGYVLDTIVKTITMYAQLANDSVVTSPTQSYGYAIDGAFFTDTVSILGYTFTKLKYKDANTSVLIDKNGKEYPVLTTANTPPIGDFTKVFGDGKTFNAIYCYGTTLTGCNAATSAKLPGSITSSYNTVYNGMISRFTNSSRTIDTVEFRFKGKVVQIKIRYWVVTTHYQADAAYDYTIVGDIMTLSNYRANYEVTSNWTNRATEIGDFATWLQAGPFKLNWVPSPTTGAPYIGGIYKVSNPADFMYGTVRKVI